LTSGKLVLGAIARFSIVSANTYSTVTRVSAPLRNKFHALLNISVANALAAPMRGVGVTVQESEPHMSNYFEPAQVQQTIQTESQDQDQFEVTPGVESRPSFQGPRWWEGHPRGCHLGIGLKQVRKTP
jgi:hypothetical protein